MSPISPFLWFDDQAEEAANFYISVFPGSRITEISRYGDAGPGTPGSVMVVSFELNGQTFQVLNGGELYTFSPAISFFVPCETQAEVDAIWDKLSEGGNPRACGWITDRYGVTWQIVPRILLEMLSHDDREKADRAMKAMLEMVKLDLPSLQAAFDGSSEYESA